MSHSTAAYGDSLTRSLRDHWGSLRRSFVGVVAEARREPALRLGQRPPLAVGVVRDLVPGDPAHHEVLGLRVAEVQAGHRGAGLHRHGLRQRYPGGTLDVEE